MSRVITLALLALTAAACASTVSATDATSVDAGSAPTDLPPLDATLDGAALDQPVITPDGGSPVVPPPPRRRLDLGSGVHFTRRDGTAVVWGDDAYFFNGEPGIEGAADWRPRPSLQAGSRATLLGGRNYCALDEAGLAGAAMRCWGDNRYGQLGDGTLEPAPPSRPTRPATNVVDAAISNGSWCVLSADGETRCWGFLVRREPTVGTLPVTVTTPVPLVRLFGCRDTPLHLGLDATGAAWCWGRSAPGTGPCLQNTASDSLVAVRIPNLPPVQSMALMGLGVCALTFNHEVYCWGWLPPGLVAAPDAGNGAVTVLTPTRAPAFSGAVALAAGAAFVLALMPTGRVLAAGRSWQLETGVSRAEWVPPSEVPGVQDVIEIDTSTGHACALTANDEVYCWGDNGGHGLGFSSAGPSRPRLVPLP